MSYQGFGKGSGPTAPAPPFVAPPQSSRPRSIESAGWTDGQKLSYKDLDAHTPGRPTPITTFIASHDSMADIGARVSRFPNPERIRSPPISYADVDLLRNFDQTALRNNHSNSHFDDHSQLRSLKSQPPPLVPVSYQSVRNFRGPSISVQQSAFAPSTFDNQTSLSANYVNFPQHQIQSSVSPYIGSQCSQHSLIEEHNITQASKRTRSPPSPYMNIQDNDARKDFQSSPTKPSISPPRLGTTSTVLRTGTDSQIHEKSLPSSVSEAAVSRPIISAAPKRTRSPPTSSLANEKPLEGNPISSEDISEHEMLAKAKRLARFKVELSKSEKNGADVADQKASANKYEQSVIEQKYVGCHLMDSDGNFTNDHGFSDYEGLEASSIIIGSCPEMCPESERGERERKGDLDQYERLDGDRSLTSRLLAYNRTAEREASLIRPMRILEKTIDYLLMLLDQPYDERFLGIYNFLWDRMRAIWMDLRMQHIFNQGAITMLEQMIRLHIIAMHELCEYTKGEGFSEGFDAHLNIEQMNKTSVELFQMYDDH